MTNLTKKLGRIIDKVRLDQITAKTYTQRRYAETVERRALAAISLMVHGSSESVALQYFRNGN